METLKMARAMKGRKETPTRRRSPAVAGTSQAPHPIDTSVGAQIRLRRRSLGMSQDELGREIGVSFQQIQKYENGGNRVSASRLAQIAEVLKMPFATFFNGAGAVEASSYTDPQLANVLGRSETMDLI